MNEIKGNWTGGTCVNLTVNLKPEQHMCELKSDPLTRAANVDLSYILTRAAYVWSKKLPVHLRSSCEINGYLLTHAERVKHKDYH